MLHSDTWPGTDRRATRPAATWRPGLDADVPLTVLEGEAGRRSSGGLVHRPVRKVPLRLIFIGRHTVRCRACDERGIVYEVPPLAADVREMTAAFARWLREAIRHHASRPGDPAFVGHRTEADVALPNGLITMSGHRTDRERRLDIRR